ncbi:hypothetical protein pipiens_008610 [Culex pipiens pipiens]|uniref:Uncharacterized protein n=1 Tax=Culex pipiens pipiens TaxID=38569 RepID=A0ABD1DGU9_CULPP
MVTVSKKRPGLGCDNQSRVISDAVVDRKLFPAEVTVYKSSVTLKSGAIKVAVPWRHILEANWTLTVKEIGPL